MRRLGGAVAGLLLVLSTVASALVLTSGPAAASCSEPSVYDLDTSDVAFSGFITTKRESGDEVITTVRVERVFKGEITRRVDVVSRADDSDPPMDGDSDDLVVVFGDLVADEVTSNSCGSVVSGPNDEYMDSVVSELGEGTAPSPGYMKAERRTFGLTYDQFVAGRAVLGVLGLAGLAYFGFRFWRGRRRTD